MFDMDSIATKFFTEIFNTVNNIVEAAVKHGGDSGGAYFSNHQELEDTLRILIAQLNCSDNFIVCYKDEYEQIPVILSKDEYCRIKHPNGEFSF